MKKFLSPLLFLCFNSSFGQFAIVNDPDSFVNVRADGQLTSKVVDRLPNGHLLYCFENKGNWSDIDYIKKEKELNGYIYKDRYKLLSDFPALTIFQKTSTSVSLKKDSFEVTLTDAKFDRKKHRFSYVKEAPGQIELIDKKRYWGTDGGMPTTQLKSIIIKAGQKRISLPQQALHGLYQPDIYSAEVHYDKTNDTFYIETSNSDGAGSYYVIWKIVKGIYTDRLVAYGF
ncbi:MAG: hypothetical protein JWQ27_57 [Ferruginibacter sp.]|nr:hypothetical protein [Ferruginibacter sp.]